MKTKATLTNGFMPIVLIGWLVTAGPVCATSTLSTGGQVNNATDGTPADGSTVIVYRPEDASAQVPATVGEYRTGFWLADVGSVIIPAVGDELIAVTEGETGQGTIAHRGYYAVTDVVIDGSDPAEHPTATLRPLPVPVVTLQPGYTVELSWAMPQQDASVGRVSGFHVYRSIDGVNFTRLTTSPVASTSFADSGFDGGNTYYAISLVYAGAPQLESSLLSANSLVIGDGDGDGMSAAFEDLHGLNDENEADAAGDKDGDGLSNLAEFQYGTNASESDSDGDGHTDPDEIDAGTDPLDTEDYPRNNLIVPIIVPILLSD